MVGAGGRLAASSPCSVQWLHSIVALSSAAPPCFCFSLRVGSLPVPCCPSLSSASVLMVLWYGISCGHGVGCTPLLLGERSHRPTDQRLVPGEGLGSPFRRCRRLSPLGPEPMELPSSPPLASWVSSRSDGVSVGWIALGGGLQRLQAGLVL